jgi:hypothetical protein
LALELAHALPDPKHERHGEPARRALVIGVQVADRLFGEGVGVQVLGL